MFFLRKIKLFDFLGLPVYVSPSFLVILFLFIIDLKSLYFGLLLCASLAFSILAHEYGHVLTARCFRCQASDITLSLLGGCASLRRMPSKPWQELLVAVAGPGVSFALSGLFFSLYLVFYMIPMPDFLYRLLREFPGVFMWSCYMNLMLGAFNLLPGFPMDGGRVLRSILGMFTKKVLATKIAMIVGRVVAIGMALWALNDFFADRDGWIFIRLMIAWMIWQEGFREYQMALMENGAYGSFGDWRARVSPPPYGGDEEDAEVRRDGDGD